MGRAALAEPWDVVISDYSLPSFSAPAAFSMVRERNLDIPFIVVSGTIGDDVAVEAMRTGVHDFLLKGPAPPAGRGDRARASRGGRPRRAAQDTGAAADLGADGVGRDARRRRRARDQQPARGRARATSNPCPRTYSRSRAASNRCRERSTGVARAPVARLAVGPEALRGRPARRRRSRRARADDRARPARVLRRDEERCAAVDIHACSTRRCGWRATRSVIAHGRCGSSATSRGLRQRGASRAGVPERDRQRRPGNPGGQDQREHNHASRTRLWARWWPSRSRTRAAASRPRSCRGSSTRSSPPSRSGSAPVWGSRSAIGSSPP